jgi:hypothetical protein
MQCKFYFKNKTHKSFFLFRLIKICLETARDAVLSLCGHLFCWPCIHQWLETRAHSPTCPVCKSSLSRDKLVPIYGRNSPQTDPRFVIDIIIFLLRISLEILHRHDQLVQGKNLVEIE